MPPLYVPLPPGITRPPIQLARATPNASATPVTATWAAGVYEQIIMKFWGRTNGYLQVQINGDSGLNYSDNGQNMNNGVISSDTAAKGVNGFARVLVTATATTKCICECSFFPLTDGFERVGQALSTSINTTGTAATAELRTTGWCWHDAVTDVTSFTVFPLGGQTMTGVVEIWGIQA